MTEPTQEQIPSYEEFVALYGNRPKDIVYNMALRIAEPIIKKQERERMGEYLGLHPLSSHGIERLQNGQTVEEE